MCVDEHAFDLGPETDVDAIKRQIIRALGEGCGFVDFRIRRRAISVLITASTHVRIEASGDDPIAPLTDLSPGSEYDFGVESGL